MRPPAPVIAFLATWSAMLVEYTAYVVYYKLTMTEPDMKFGDSAPYITLTVMGGLGGFVAALGALIATITYGERHLGTVRPSLILKVSVMASVPFSLGAWYAAVWSPLPILGTLAAWLAVCATTFFALLYVTFGQRRDA